jgi:Multicopper oxidase
MPIVATGPDCAKNPGKVAFCDPLSIVGGSVPEAGGATPSAAVDAWHDTIPVPPRDADGNPGRVFVSIPFKAREQVGRFVFHCHILEHEDGGMMAPVEVLGPETVAQQQHSEPVSFMKPMPGDH